jgi:predicted Rossmann-fold nucleotide-binding protein
MTHAEELRQILTEHIIPEVEDVMEVMNDHLKENEATDEMLQEHAGIQAIHKNFLNILNAVDSGEISEDECVKIMQEIIMLRNMGNKAEG